MVKPTFETACGRDPTFPEWCAVCCTRHPIETRCPGSVQATGPERFGWKVIVETPHSVDAYGVLVAPAGPVWRARILTYPNSLWTLPGGRGVLKFVGRTPQAAEEQAIRFVEEHCARRGYVLRTGLDLSLSPPFARPRPVPTTPQPTAPPRWPLVLPVAYGPVEAVARAVTRNLSECGIFVQTPSPAGSGSDLVLRLSLDASPVDLRGVVQWIRRNAEVGRPPGMGIRLVERPPRFVSYVQSLPPPPPAEGFAIPAD